MSVAPERRRITSVSQQIETRKHCAHRAGQHRPVGVLQHRGELEIEELSGWVDEDLHLGRRLKMVVTKTKGNRRGEVTASTVSCGNKNREKDKSG